MIYFRMIWTENEYGETYELMQQCSEFSYGLVLQINEVKNPELVQDVLANPDKYYFTDSLQLYKRDVTGDILISVSQVEAPPNPSTIVTNNNVEIKHDINPAPDNVSHYETLIYEVAPVDIGTATGIADPTIAPTLAQNTGGSILDGTYYLKFSYINSIGNTLASPAQTIVITGGGGTASIDVTTPPLPFGAKGIVVYMSTDNLTFYVAGGSETSNTCNIGIIPTEGGQPPTVNSTAANSTQIADTTKNLTSNIYAGKAIKITSGTGAGQERVIISNTATEITIDFPFDPAPDTTSQYQIRTFIKKSGLQTSWNFSGLAPNTDYYIKIRAYDVAGHYTDTAETQITTGASRPDIPLHGETHKINRDDYIAPADIGAETPTGAQTKVDTHGSVNQTHGALDPYRLAKTSRIDQLPAWADIPDKPSDFPPAPHNHTPEEIGAVAKTGDTMSGNLNLADNELQQAKIKDYSETVATVANSGAAYTIDLSAGNIYDVTLTANCTFTFANPPASGAGSLTLILRQDATGGWTVTWPSSVKWPNATAPTLSAAANAIDILTFFTVDGGTTWFGVLAGGGLG